MSYIDLTDETEQQEFTTNGPVPEGSIVMLEMKVLEANNKAHDNIFISVASTGLRQIYCEFTVCYGSYSGVHFRDFITLPLSQQQITLTSGQERGCLIGGATLKAICQAARKPTKLNDWSSLTGLRFPARVKINPRPSMSKDGTREYWNNSLSTIITPDKEQYAMLINGGEIINENGAVTGSSTPSHNNGYATNASARNAQLADKAFGADGEVDDIPF